LTGLYPLDRGVDDGAQPFYIPVLRVQDDVIDGEIADVDRIV
jgi:hypothetical protein